MSRTIFGVCMVAGLTGAAAAQDTLYAVDFAGSLYKVDTATGSAMLVGPTGFNRFNAAAASPSGEIYVSRFRDSTVPGDQFSLIRVDPATGVGTLVAAYSTGGDLRGLAFVAGTLYGIQDAGFASDLLVSIDPASGAITPIGPMTPGDLQGLSEGPGGGLYALSITSGGELYKVDPSTGTTTFVAGNLGAGTTPQSLEWNGESSFWLGRTDLYTVSVLGGTASLVGSMGVGDVRGFAYVPGGSCYANCDGSTTSPALNVSDFGCFLSKFAAGDPYANCDGSTGAPQLNVADFGCFLSKFAAGCN